MSEAYTLVRHIYLFSEIIEHLFGCVLEVRSIVHNTVVFASYSPIPVQLNPPEQ